MRPDWISKLACLLCQGIISTGGRKLLSTPRHVRSCPLSDKNLHSTSSFRVFCIQAQCFCLCTGSDDAYTSVIDEDVATYLVAGVAAQYLSANPQASPQQVKVSY